MISILSHGLRIAAPALEEDNVECVAGSAVDVAVAVIEEFVVLVVADSSAVVAVVVTVVSTYLSWLAAHRLFLYHPQRKSGITRY